jgi:hypothetical protein
MPVLPATSLQDTVLFVRLQALERDHRCPPGLAGNVLALCTEAAQRLKAFPTLHPQFTLHDETHCLRVVQLMGEVVASVADRLNAIEIALLILAAYFHDQGMIVESSEIDRIRQSDEWKIHEQNWISDHPNYAQIGEQIADPGLTAAERDRAVQNVADLRAAMWTDFIRRSHGQRSAQFISDAFRDDSRLVVYSRSLTDLLALLCESHVRSPDAINPSNAFAFDELVGTVPINLGLLAHVLRLADILDFDRERTPSSLYRAIAFTNATSIAEWEKHRSVVGWSVASDRIVFAAECEHPAYERAIRDFMDLIDSELAAVQSWNRSLPTAFRSHELVLPPRVDRDRIRARTDLATREPIYRYRDLEFSLSRDEIVKVLMTEQLYANRSLFIRELLQNALDALRHRRALYRSAGVTLPDLHVDFEHYQDARVDVVRCVDNGSGMDEDIVQRFLTKAGRSYYRSAEFERERTRFREKGCDFDPCARFGIGFMSCFMFGDEITLFTRRDHGLGREHGRPLVVEIAGLSGIVAIRPGSADQPVGTSVEIRGRVRSVPTDVWSDRVRLLEILEAFALAVEFPVRARCKVPEIAGEISIEPGFTSRRDQIESSVLTKKRVFTASFHDVDERLNGELRVSTLVDDAGVPSIANEEASIRVTGTPPRKAIVRADGSVIGRTGYDHIRQLCCDGILVAGSPGRHRALSRLGWRSLHYGFGDAAFILDARGDIKPELTPARTPPDDMLHHEQPSWKMLFEVASPAYSKILAELVSECRRVTDPERFWAVAEAHGLSLSRLPLSTAFESLKFPFARGDENTVQWRSLHELGPCEIMAFREQNRSVVAITTADGLKLRLPSTLQQLQTGESAVSLWAMAYLIAACSLFRTTSSSALQVTPASAGLGGTLAAHAIGDRFSRRYLFQFHPETADVISVCGPLQVSNREHFVTQRYRSVSHKRWLEYSPLERLLSRLVWGVVGSRFDGPAENTSDLRVRKELGLLYRAVDWSTVDARLRPPFAVLRPGYGVDRLTGEHLHEWSLLVVPAEPDVPDDD